MYLKAVKFWNFRKFGSNDNFPRNPDLEFNLSPGLNLLVGENDSGKSAILDGIKILLYTRSNEFIRLKFEDFYHSPNNTNPNKRLRIECIFSGLTDNEAKNFLEWLTIKTTGASTEFTLRIFLEAELDGHNVRPYEIKAGSDEEGVSLTPGARELLKVTYLKPLRDAETELSSKKNSRLSQILDSHEAFVLRQGHPLREAMRTANESIRDYFKGLGADRNPVAGHPGKALSDTINNLLNEFFGTPKESRFEISDQSLKTILEKLELILEKGNNGLGSHNLLFIATELLLLTRTDFTGLRLALIEEIEAHLHPQAQLRLIEYLSKEAEHNKIQLLLSTHSPTLASKVKVEQIALCKSNSAFSLAPEYTQLEIGDYDFLSRFLDATKSNLFFAQGVIMVEGDAENILLPAIAKVIGRDLTKYGVSVVNMGNTAFKRYSRIFLRKDPAKLLDVPVACITDNDIDLAAGMNAQQIEDNRIAKAAEYDGQNVKTFVSPIKTMEYDLALGALKHEMYLCSLLADKLKNSDKYSVTEAKRNDVRVAFDAKKAEWQQQSSTASQIAVEIYDHIKDKQLKTITAQFFADYIVANNDAEGIADKIKQCTQFNYLVQAIEHVTAPLNPPQNV